MAEPLLVEERTRFGLATVMARRGATAEAIGAALGLALPPGPERVVAGERSVAGIGPGVWLVECQRSGPALAADLARTLDGIASVSDQSSGYIIVRLRGAGARTLLQRGAAIDFAADAFGPGSVATTMIAHIGVIVWQIDDRPTYDVALFRSFADSFRHWLGVTAAAL